MSSVKEIKSGTFYLLVSKYSGIFIKLLISAIIARLLTPEEFGIVAAVMVFLNFFQLIGNSGLGSAVIQKKDLSKKDISSIFNLSIFFSLFLSLVLWAFSLPISGFFNDDVYTKIVPLMSLSLFLYTANSIPLSLLYKDKRFKLVGILRVIVELITGLLAIYLALNEFSYYALIYRNIAMAFLILIFNINLSGMNFSLKTDFSVLRKILSFSSFHTLYTTVNYFTRNLDNLLIAKLLGAASLGFYDKAYSLIMLPISNITRSLNTVLHPVLAEHESNPKKVLAVYKKVAKYLFVIGSFLSVYLFFSAEEVIRLLYGDQWIKSIPAFKFLALTIGIQMVYVSSGPIFLAVNKPKYLLVSGVITSLTTAFAILAGILFYNSITAIAFFLIFSFIVSFIQTYFILVTKVLKHRFRDFLNSMKLGFIITISLLAVNLPLEYFISTDSLILMLIFKTFISAGTFALVLFVLDELEGFIFVFKLNKKGSKKDINDEITGSLDKAKLNTVT